MEKALTELIKISNAVGKNKLLVQGGGGNTSVKTENGKHMYIKASGTALKDMNAGRGWRRLKVKSVLSILEDTSITELSETEREKEIVNRLNQACDDNIKTGSRPSVESHLHALLDRCVIHLHPVAVSAYVCAKAGRAELERLFRGEEFPPLWVPYVDPGYTLAMKVSKLVNAYKKRFGAAPKIIFLQKHGLLISTNTAHTALRLVQRVINICESKLRPSKPVKVKKPKFDDIIAAKLAIRQAYFETRQAYVAVRYFIDGDIGAFLKRKDAKRLLSLPGLTPDELVYAHGPAMWLDKNDYKTIANRLKERMIKSRIPSVAFLVNGLGLFIVGTEKTIPDVKDIVTGSFLVRSSATNFGGLNPLNRRQRDFINKWEAESFRRKIAAEAGQRQLRDRLAIVTGAGSGLGRSIAIGLAREGALVGLLDIDRKAATQTRDLIKKELPEASTMILSCNVTDEANVDKAFKSLLENWGGMDILVNAAGIAPPYSLTELPVGKWRQALEVNLTGYFLMARAAAKIMIRQGMGGNIINISSKSGLEASKDNTAYNATKAGEIHMTRGWAHELGEYGIRVNCLAPGNVFEGSKIWNPEYIRICARKYGIKPEEVIPYYVKRTALKREIKGQDIADAVIFLCSEKARTITGQTLVADSGQVMVR
ncbi:MAG: hypothetical protein AMS15_07560 [Planctomycetes bacterium DG_23]|nr:MAG: hypothetical protein AMS15_07560 [Planctomycetes bacterium DG_23]